jgi:hypothetical protein
MSASTTFSRAGSDAEQFSQPASQRRPKRRMQGGVLTDDKP